MGTAIKYYFFKRSTYAMNHLLNPKESKWSPLIATAMKFRHDNL
jgi:hypothetical protein